MAALQAAFSPDRALQKTQVSVTHSALISDVAQAHHTIASDRGIDVAA